MKWARMSYAFGIAFFVYVMVEPGVQVVESLLSGAMISVGAAFGWE